MTCFKELHLVTLFPVERHTASICLPCTRDVKENLIRHTRPPSITSWSGSDTQMLTEALLEVCNLTGLVIQPSVRSKPRYNESSDTFLS